MSKQGGRRAAAGEGTDWTALHEWLVAYAVRDRGVPRPDAEQLAQEALRRFHDPLYAPYAPAVHGDVKRYLLSLMNGLLQNYRRRSESASWLVQQAIASESPPTPEEEVMQAEQARFAMTKLRERTVRDPLARKVIDLTLDGVSGPREQADHLGVRVEEVYEARRRIKAYVTAVSILLGGN